MPRRQGLIDAGFVAAFLLSATAIFVYLHYGGSGDRVCAARGVGGPGTFSLWPPGTHCYARTESLETQVYTSDLFLLALAGCWTPIAGAYLVLRRMRPLPAH